MKQRYKIRAENARKDLFYFNCAYVLSCIVQCVLGDGLELRLGSVGVSTGQINQQFVLTDPGLCLQSCNETLHIKKK